MPSVPSSHSSTGRLSFPQPAETQLIREQYLSEWTEWAENCAPGENRALAFSRLKLCLENNESHLDLSELNLTSLPSLPEHVMSLKIDNNSLTSLPRLPYSLEKIEASFNQLETLPSLPESLTVLSVRGNRLSILPELPLSLNTLNVNGNNLSTLPDLPNSLTILNVSGNRLTALPELPAAMTIVNAQSNALERLPDFPVENNQMPRIFWLSQNQITHIPESITGLNEISLVDLENNPLSNRILQSLQQLMSSPDYHGPQIHFSMSNGQQHTPVRSLPEAVAAWFPESLRSEVSQRWGAFTDEENASTFAAFLDRLADTVTARNAPGIAQQVSEFLEKLSRSEALRQQCFAVAADATRSCEDRVALTWNNLQKTYRVHQASEGEFDSDLTGLLSLGREMYRLEVLEEIAREKVKTLHFVDEIEVYLAFQTMLAEKLELSTAVREMRFYGVSGVTEDDLSSALARVVSREEREFAEWFARWSPWHAVLKRTEAERWARAEEKKYEMLEREYPQRLAERLSALGLSGDGDAEREAGVRVMEEIETEIYRQLTEEVSGGLSGGNGAH
ncbi:NEL-type E3 ubiquitin ligase domain-containing protein [Escherichia marmotae]|uniref:NEL-type E3 ubiquitin ligase domain-containing protein n=2 Tax=Escherichia marmotae TaxID=1499973 RepID=UPI000CCCA1D4|nr:NEL-type E3 ubiquitin ligase domain-containing protein [Escherichia marmotae]AUT27439.1 E3 ubiquitin--protein ligase [Escherichia marmotae]